MHPLDRPDSTGVPVHSGPSPTITAHLCVRRRLVAVLMGRLAGEPRLAAMEPLARVFVQHCRCRACLRTAPVPPVHHRMLDRPAVHATLSWLPASGRVEPKVADGPVLPSPAGLPAGGTRQLRGAARNA